MKRIAVIGAGLSGLANAALLAKEGYDVTVVERHSIPGGVARKETVKGYTFDMGPTWFLMPDIYKRYFAEFGAELEEHLDLVELDPSYRVFFEGNGSVDLSRDLDKNKKVFDSFEKDGGSKLEKFLRNSAMKYDIAMNEFLYTDYKSVLQLLDPALLFKGLKLSPFEGLHGFAKRFFKDHRSQKIVEFNTVFLGSSPFKTPALYSLMAHADLTQGVFYPGNGGIYNLADALYKLASSYGAVFKFEHEVEHIVVENKKAVGVRTVKGFVPADIVLSTTDYHHAETQLLDEKWRNYSRGYWERKVVAPSTVLLFLGVKKKLPALAHHNFFFAHDWEDHFDTIFDNPAWPANPSYYIGCPSRSDSTIAPEGCENLFVLVPIAPGLDDSDKRRGEFADKTIAHMEKTIGTSFSDSIEVKKIFSGRDFKESYNMYRGSALGISHTLFQTAFFRPSHTNKKVDNLFYAGHNTQPGIGMPMVIIGSQMLKDAISHRYPPRS